MIIRFKSLLIYNIHYIESVYKRLPHAPIDITSLSELEFTFKHYITQNPKVNPTNHRASVIIVAVVIIPAINVIITTSTISSVIC